MTDQAMPRKLGLAGRRLWRRVVAVHELEVWEATLVEEACRTADLLDRLHSGLDLKAPDPKLLREIRLQQETMRKLLTSIGWPSPDETWDGLSASERGRRAAFARWRR